MKILCFFMFEEFCCYVCCVGGVVCVYCVCARFLICGVCVW